VSSTENQTLAATQPSLGTSRLLLRPFQLSDAPRVRELAGDRAIADTTLAIPHPYPEGAAEAWIGTHAARFAEGAEAAFAITRRDGGELIGAIGLLISKAHARAELGYWIGRSYWGHGFATEAGRAVLEFGFGALRLHRVQAHYLTRNLASGRVLEKLGLTLEGVHRGAVKKWDVHEDLGQRALLSNDWDRAR
jgi:ribosomal-protein-alanine N-acetyltransferase